MVSLILLWDFDREIQPIEGRDIVNKQEPDTISSLKHIKFFTCIMWCDQGIRTCKLPLGTGHLDIAYLEIGYIRTKGFQSRQGF